MLNDILKSDSLTGMVKIMFAAGLNRVGERATKKVSITKDASSIAFEFPVICTSDVPEEVMVMMGKFYETKLAMDIATLLGRDVIDGSDVTFTKLIDSLPYARGVYTSKDSQEKIKETIGAVGSIMESIDDGIRRRIVEQRHKTNLENVIESDGYGLGMNASSEEFWYEVTDKASLIEAEIIEPKRGALPTQVKIPIRYKINDGEFKSLDFVFNVKCNIHSVPYRELYTRLASSDLNFTKSWIKFRKNKGYKFIKDLILDIDTIKNKAKYDVNKSTVFSDIELQKAKKSIGAEAYPFVCFVVSNDFVKELKDKGDADLTVPGGVQKVLKSTLGLAWGTYAGDSINLAFDGQSDLLAYSTSEIYKETDRVAKDLRETISQFKRSSF